MELSSLTDELRQKFAINNTVASGVVVSDIDPDGVAAQRGLQIGDVILEVGGRLLNKPADVSAALAEAKKANRKAVLLRVRVRGSKGTYFVPIAITQGDLVRHQTVARQSGWESGGNQDGFEAVAATG